MFNKVKEAVENAMSNGYEPLAMKARDLATDLVDKASDFAEDIVEAVKAVKKHFDEDEEDE